MSCGGEFWTFFFNYIFECSSLKKVTCVCGGVWVWVWVWVAWVWGASEHLCHLCQLGE